ncbi:MAG: phosphoserine phosphatase SerB [Myxococcales bacterium]|jgi:phosphoserine phosphatase
MASEIVLINISGSDRPGITHRLTTILAEHHARVLDIGQAVIHRSLALGMLVQLPDGAEASGVIKDVLFAAHEMSLQVDFSPITEADYADWVHEQGRPRHIITTFGSSFDAGHLSQITDILRNHGLNIAVIMRISGRPPLGQEEADEVSRACIEWSVRGAPDDASDLRRDLLVAAQDLGIDIAIQVDDIFRRNRRMICFDMDSTLIQAECIDELARAAGVHDQVSAVTEAAMNGELNFNESLQKRLALLEGLPESTLAEVADRLPLTDGAERLIRTLKSVGYKTAILSGGFTYFGERLRERLGIDYVYANELEIEGGKLTGRVVGEIVDGERKAQLVRELAEREGIKLQQVVAVGDGANDLPMLEVAGLGIAFHAKPTVRASAGQSISSGGLDGILYLIGFRDREIDQNPPCGGF